MRILLYAFVVVSCVGTVLAGPVTSQQTAQTFVGESHRPVRLPYLLFVPEDYKKDATQQWPLLLYLHGGSRRGDDIERVREMGLPHRLEEDRKFPFIVVSPLCPA